MCVATVVSVLVSSLSLVLNGEEEVQMTSFSGKVITVNICRYDENYRDTHWQSVLTSILTAAFVVTITLTVFFYVLVFRALRQFENRASMINRNSSSLSPSTPVPSPDDDEPGPDAALHFPGTAHRAYLATDINGESHPPTPPEIVRKQPNTAEEKRNKFKSRTARATSIFSIGGTDNRVSSQMYKTFLIITWVFIISYLPHLVVKILDKALGLERHTLTYVQRVFYEIAYNCPYISTVANAVVYGFRCEGFRDHCKKMFSCDCPRNRRSRRY